MEHTNEAPAHVAGSELKTESQADTTRTELTTRVALLACLTTALAACGGGGGGGGTESAPTPAPPAPAATPPSSSTPPPPPAPPSPTTPAPPATAPSPAPPAASISAAQASRFLSQAAFGGSDTQIAKVQSQGYSAWLDEQFSVTGSQSHWDWMVANGYNSTTYINNFAGVDNTLWRKLLSSPDVLRQRMALALSEIFVVSMAGLPVQWRGMAVASYVDTLNANAFGNYRQLLEAVTLSPAMGVYLNMRGNQKANTAGRQPDENYAREVMQLFTIGLTKLNADGSNQLSSGLPIDSYSQIDITQGLARVFTGWDFDTPSNTVPDHMRRPMIFNATRHSPETKSFLGVNLPAGTDGVGELKIALDTLCKHPNVGPFIGKQLIQRLVTSNPSAAYVARVSAAFNDNGSGVRGDMKAVIKAVLLDAEARAVPTAATAGKLREPMLRFMQWARTFNANSAGGLWTVGDTSSPSTRLGQSPLRSPSVFNFFRPGYVPSNTGLSSQGLTAPEMQITNESTVVGYANWMQSVISNGAGDVRGDYSAYLSLANDAGALFDQFNLLLAANQLDASSRSTIVTAVGSITASSDAARLNRIYATALLILTSPQYITLK